MLPLAKLTAFAAERRLLYIAVPGIRNYVEYGGVGVLVYDIGRGYTFVKRIPTWDVPEGQQPENVKGVAASAQDGEALRHHDQADRLHRSPHREDGVEQGLEGGCDRLAISPDGQILYVPSLEGPHWNVVDAMSGDDHESGDGFGRPQHALLAPRHRVYLAGLRSPSLSIADTKTHKVVEDRRSVLGADPALHGERRPDAVLRQRQRAARLRDRRYPDRPEAAPRRGPGLRAGPREASRVPQPRHRPDARRKGTVVVRRRQQRGARLRQHRHAAEADGHAPRARSTRLDHLQHRRPARLSVHRRGLRDPAPRK